MDRREHSHQWWHTFDEKAMTVTIEEARDDGEDLVVPVKYEVCETCEGKGKHVNPSIDSHGLTAEDFDQDPDFREDYHSGAYDVWCAECHGERVVPTPDYDHMSAEVKAAVEEHIDGFYRNRAEEAAERRMGY